jgi:hypothetical protein
MRLQLAESGLSQATTPGGPSALDKASQIINSIQAVKNIPFVGEALQIANGLVSILNVKEKKEYDKVLDKARNIDVLNWWRTEGNQGSPWEPMTSAKAEWLVSRLGAAVKTVSQEMIGLRKGTGAVTKARWVKAYQALLDEVLANQKKVTDGPGLPGLPGLPSLPGVTSNFGKYLPFILGGVAIFFLLNRRK